MSINLLKQVYAAAHPGVHLNRPHAPAVECDREAEADLFAMLAAEAEVDGEL